MSCDQINAHITSSRFFNAGHTTDEAKCVFCDMRRMQRWLDVEVALLRCQEKQGVIPAKTAEQLEKTALIELFDTNNIQNEIKATGHSLIPLLNEWQRIAGSEHGHFIHFGATTQDIQDTAQSLELKDIFKIIDRDLVTILEILSKHAIENKDLVQIGRTHGQPALPTTFGLKIAGWLDELLRCAERIDECRNRVLVSQLFGGVGTMSALGENPFQLLENFSARLGLSVPECAWHASRDRISEFLSNCAILGSTFGKIANEIAQLSRSEIGELEEPFHMGKIGSSTMPHKRNPELCEQVVVLSRLIKSNAGLGYDGMINEHERDYRAVRLEWITVADSAMYLCGAFSLMKAILANLIVHKDKITRNVNDRADSITTEALMFQLGERIGKQNAHALLYEISMTAHNENKSIMEILADHPDIVKHLDKKRLQDIINPQKHIGQAVAITEQITKKVRNYIDANKNRIAQINLNCPLAETCKK